jgi:hypothetical protein
MIVEESTIPVNHMVSLTKACLWALLLALAWTALTLPAEAAAPAASDPRFKGGVSPAGLLKAAIVPTAILWIIFLVLG